jgi:hypothetical protein
MITAWFIQYFELAKAYSPLSPVITISETRYRQLKKMDVPGVPPAVAAPGDGPAHVKPAEDGKQDRGALYPGEETLYGDVAS